MASEFADELLRMIRVDQRVRARPFAEAGYPCPAGVQVRLPTGALLHLQVVTAPYTDALPRPDTGAPPPQTEPVELPEEGQTELVAVERWLARLITTDQSPQIEAVELFQDRRGRVSIPHGLAIRMHSGARAWIYFRHPTPAGRDPRSMALWRAQASV